MRLLLACIVLLWTIPASAQTRFAILVGHNIGDTRETPLRWAERDATRVLKVLTELGNVREDRAELLLAPKKAELSQALIRMQGRLSEAKNRGENTLLFFYYSGHGDRKELHLGPETIPIALIERQLQDIGANTVLTIVDACQNDRNPRVKEKGAVRAPAFQWPKNETPMPEGFVKLSSAAAGEVAQESDDLQGSLFTHHLLSGMRGSADFDKDGTITLSEVYRYGYSRTLEETHRGATAVQHSSMQMALSGRGTLILSYPRRASAALLFRGSLRGHVLVIDDATGRIVAEFYASSNEQLLALAPGKYRIQLRGQSEIRSGLVALGFGQKKVTLEDLSPQPLLSVLTKGSQYDPHPYVLSVGAAASTSRVSNFGLWGGARVGLDYRLSESLSIGVLADAGYSETENELWSYRQMEIDALIGVEWMTSFEGILSLSTAARLGMIAIGQEGLRKDRQRLRDIGIPEDRLQIQNWTLGPAFSTALGLEYHSWSRVSWRLAVEPMLSLVNTPDSLELNLSVLGTLSARVRL